MLGSVAEAGPSRAFAVDRKRPASACVTRHNPPAEPVAVMPKPFTKLNRVDLQQSPVWAWTEEDGAADGDDGPDESCVQQTGLSQLPRSGFAQYLVATTFGLRDGSTLPGISEVTIAEGSVSVQPTTVLLLDRHLQVPSVETNRLLTRFTKTIDNHPTTWKLDVKIEGESKVRSGKIKGGDMKNIVAAGMAVLLALKALRK